MEEYSLKFTRLIKYASSWVSHLIYEMSRFVTGLYDLFKEECHTAMLNDDMNISRLMVYAQSITKSKLRITNKDLNRSNW